MRTIVLLAFGLVWAVSASAQVGSSISADGSAPNNNAMLDVKSPSSGDGKGILIPRVTQAQRTTADGNQAGGLLDTSGNLRGGAAQGLIVYQTDNPQGLYFNTSPSATPAWVYLGAYTETDPLWTSVSNAIVADIATRLVSNVWAAAGSTTNYLPRTGGTMSGVLNMGAQIVSNVAYIDFGGSYVSVGREADGSSSGAAIGYQANGSSLGTAMGRQASGADSGAALGFLANGNDNGVALGISANGAVTGVAVGASANGYDNGTAVGPQAIGTNCGAAVGYQANGVRYGAAIGYQANGYWCAAVGYRANSVNSGAAVGYSANGIDYGAAMGENARGTNYGAAMGWAANGSTYGVAVGRSANGYDNGAVVGYYADGFNSGAALGYLANGARTNVAIGARANAQGGTQRIAIGNDVTNTINGTVRIRGHLYLDGGTNILTNSTFGGTDWGIKAFTIDHPLDPENKILRHYCLEGPQVWNVYAGNAQLVNGQAVIELPDYYSALNLVGSEIYSLTPISSDRRATAVIEQEVINNCFVIGGSSDIKVSWTIKVLRNDPGCREDLRRRPVEQLKSEIK